MKILLDADAPPQGVKQILFRAAERRAVELVVVSNSPIPFPDSTHIRALVVAAGPDEADRRITALVEAGDLVITADIPLAARVIERGAEVIDFRGTLVTRENIGERLAMRDFLEDLRGAGADIGGPPRFSQRQQRDFANQFDRWLSKAFPG